MSFLRGALDAGFLEKSPEKFQKINRFLEKSEAKKSPFRNRFLEIAF
jgi:hypothetical protein